MELSGGHVSREERPVTPSFIIPEAALPSFTDLVELGAENLKKLAAALANQEATLDIDFMARELSKQIKWDALKLSRAITSVLIPLSSLRVSFRTEFADLDFSEILGGRLRELFPDWWKSNGKKWEKIASVLEPLLDPAGNYSCRDLSHR
jgi:hypothetical protein